jgi:uncharacterized protein DUF899
MTRRATTKGGQCDAGAYGRNARGMACGPRRAVRAREGAHLFGPQYTAGCPTCSAGADTFDGAVVHLNHRDVTFLCASRAPLEKLQDYKRRMGWKYEGGRGLQA